MSWLGFFIWGERLEGLGKAWDEAAKAEGSGMWHCQPVLCPCDSPAWGGQEGGGSQPGGLLLSLTCEGRGLHQGAPPHTPAWDTGGSHPQPPLSLLQQSSSLPPSLPSPALMEVPSGHLKIIKRRLKFLLCPFTVGFPAGKQGDLFRDCNIS